MPIFYDGFELDPWPYPTDPWKIYDLSDDGKDRVWNDVSYRSYTGSWSAWPAGGGFDGKAPSPDDENYFNNLNTWMIYGPFDLSDAQDAAMAFYLWRDIKANDTLFYGASLNGLDFYGDFVDGTVDWTDTFFDLSSYAGHNAVWVGWQFKSDASGTAAGPYIDDILIAKFVADAPNVFRLFLPTTIKQEGGAPGPELCDQYEPNDRLSTAFGPLVSGEVYTARMCADDKEDLYYFQAAQPGQVQITLNLAQSLYPEASLYLYAPDGRTLISGCYNAPPQSGRTGTSKPIIVSCAVTAGKQTLRITTKGTTNPANQYTVKVVFPQ
ncbi:MAG TPA: hypothetical protein VKE41_06375 [Roseiflexaceae bacterium]|nr:hypothetical protein [Roseiflexaceae bacterium]